MVCFIVSETLTQADGVNFWRKKHAILVKK